MEKRPAVLDPEPLRPAVQVLAAVDINISAKRKVKAGEAMPIDHRSGKENEDKKGGEWQPNKKLRQDSRRVC